ncbi:hypothetical protein [Pseudomonas protegens]|jgi:hypothetical protein|uniref:hypothetical protein n=1 Tax=Pseudomonas protegens TaxID=380021 RepID=UPI000A755F61|nr:hypothetical protein [Pseudomonas protegens]
MTLGGLFGIIFLFELSANPPWVREKSQPASDFIKALTVVGSLNYLDILILDNLA